MATCDNSFIKYSEMSGNQFKLLKKSRRGARGKKKDRQLDTTNSSKTVENWRIREHQEENNLADNLQTNNTFPIKVIKHQSFGLFIRQRSTKCRYINLKSFIKKKIPCVFVSKLRSSSGNYFRNLRLSKNQYNKENVNSKPVRRKYQVPIQQASIPIEAHLENTEISIPTYSLSKPVAQESFSAMNLNRDEEINLSVPSTSNYTIDDVLNSVLQNDSSENITPGQFKKLRKIINTEVENNQNIIEINNIAMRMKQLFIEKNAKKKNKEQVNPDSPVLKRHTTGEMTHPILGTEGSKNEAFTRRQIKALKRAVNKEASGKRVKGKDSVEHLKKVFIEQNHQNADLENKSIRIRTFTNSKYQARSGSQRKDSVSDRVNAFKRQQNDKPSPSTSNCVSSPVISTSSSASSAFSPTLQVSPKFSQKSSDLVQNETLVLSKTRRLRFRNKSRKLLLLDIDRITSSDNLQMPSTSSAIIVGENSRQHQVKVTEIITDSESSIPPSLSTMLPLLHKKETPTKEKQNREDSVTPDGKNKKKSPKKKKSESVEPEGSKSPGTKKSSKTGKKGGRERKPVGNENFEDYISEAEALAGLESGELVKGFVRINPKNFKMAYVSHSDSTEQDYVIDSVVDRNRALEGDEVLLAIKPQTEWVEGYKTAKVVFILNKIHPRIAIGKLKFVRNNTDAEFYPRDQRFPILKIPPICWPIGFQNQPNLFEDALFMAKLTYWRRNCYPLGLLTECLGISGDLKVEAYAILKECCLDVTPFPPEYNMYLPESEDIPESEFNYREDFRKECVFTIDPLTAKDLDDAVSCKQLPNGNYEIGVHISDASFYLADDTPLDKKVSEKATTVYMVDRAYHMLPVEMCLYCSLLPGKDKLAFSVIWEMTEDAEVLNCRFTRSIINSCTQLAYEHAQMMIENPDKEFNVDEIPAIQNGYTSKDISRIVNILNYLAVKMRKKRFDDGALKIDQIKLSFMIDPLSGEPLDFSKQVQKDANKLIEEFMLLANISVAQQIYDAFPHLAFLRCHEPPKNAMLVDLQRGLETFGIYMDTASSKSLRTSMEKYSTDDYFGQCRSVVLNHLLTKPMTRARYYCAGNCFNMHGHEHYALSVPIYTHFTSPIRRYADIMVHRLLAASLGYREKPNWNIDRVSYIAANCNAKKYSAKKAGEAHAELYLIHYINSRQPFIQDAAVVDVKEKSYDVIVLTTGTIVRLYLNKFEKGVKVTHESTTCRNLNTSIEDITGEEREKKMWKHILEFPKTGTLDAASIVIELFSIVRIALMKVPKKNKLEGKLLRPMANTVCTGL